MEVEFTKLSSKGQVVIPQDIRESLKLREGTPFAIVTQDDTILLKKMDLPKIKTWKEATKPFRTAAKKCEFSREDLARITEEVRMAKR
jgi:AbrB family looped-hinge helix DNA binding protein